jgi:Effector-associated domain 11
MKKEIVTGLIEDNRFKEAIDILKKETRDTYLYNQVILLSASYEDYLKLEITGTEDFSVRSQRRAQLVNGLLHTVDKVVELKGESSPVKLPKVELPKIELPKIERPTIVIPEIKLPKINLPTIGIKHVKIVGFGVSLAILLPLLFYFIKNMDGFLPTPTKTLSPESFNVEIKTIKNDSESLYTEGGKITVKIDGLTDKNLMLNAEGRAFLTDLPLAVKDKNLSVQFEDTSIYCLVNQIVTKEGNRKIIKASVKLQTLIFSGRLVKFDLTAVKNATLDFGNGMAKATTNEQGEYTVELPKNIGNTVELSILVDDKVVMSRQVLVNDKVLRLLKVY